MKRFALLILIFIFLLLGMSSAKSEGPVKSAEAQRLMQLLNDINGEKTLSGAMSCVNWNISEAQ